MSLRKILLFPFVAPIIVYTMIRLTRAKGGAGAVAYIQDIGKDYDRRMSAIDQQWPQGSYTHKRLTRKLRESARERIKEASVKKS